MSLLSIRDLSLSFRGIHGVTEVLHGISLDIEPGEKVALVGESGSGKSVTARIVLGLLQELSSCLLYTSPSPRDGLLSRMPSSA